METAHDDGRSRDRRPISDDPYEPIGPVATHFHDLHSNGTQQTDYHHIFVELPRETALEWFRETFDSDPTHVSCTCCGPDFSVMQSSDLVQATAHERNCEFVRVDGETGRGHYIEEAKTLDTGSHEFEHIPFEEYVENAATVVGDPSENGALVIQHTTLDAEWQPFIDGLER